MSRRTEREKLWSEFRLRLADGRRIEKHPTILHIRSLLCRVVVDNDPRRCQGAVEQRWNNSWIPSHVVEIMETTMTMEEMNSLLRQSNAEVDESLAALHTAYNKTTAVRDQLIPQLADMVRQIRQSRMTAEGEMRQTLEWLQTVRDFFLEKSYEKEMDRLRDFISLCKQIKALKDDGTLDAVSDLALKMAS